MAGIQKAMLGKPAISKLEAVGEGPDRRQNLIAKAISKVMRIARSAFLRRPTISQNSSTRSVSRLDLRNKGGESPCNTTSPHSPSISNFKRSVSSNVDNAAKWWPSVYFGSQGEIRFRKAVQVAQQTEASKALAGRQMEFENNAVELLARFSEIADACKMVAEGETKRVSDLDITGLISNEKQNVWSAQEPDCNVGFACSEIELDISLPAEAVLWSLYCVDERLQWDGVSFKQYDVLCEATPQAGSNALGDVVCCRMPVLPGLSDRDVVQERFILKLSEEQGGGLAMLMCSPSDERASALGRPAGGDATRARTHLAGFRIRPSKGGLTVTAMSKTDPGGNIPFWAVNLAKRAGKHKPIDWANRLRDHCLKRTEEARPQCTNDSANFSFDEAETSVARDAGVREPFNSAAVISTSKYKTKSAVSDSAIILVLAFLFWAVHVLQSSYWKQP
jgi:hypothetical protein